MPCVGLVDSLTNWHTKHQLFINSLTFIALCDTISYVCYVYRMPINDDLAELYREKLLIEKRLSQLSSKIGLLQGSLDEQIIIETVGYVIDDDEEFVKWYKKRKERLDRKKRKNQSRTDAKPDKEFTHVYSLLNDGEIVYIGVTNNVHSRMLQHKRDKTKTFDRHKILATHVDRFYALREENTLIKKHQPKYNKSWYW